MKKLVFLPLILYICAVIFTTVFYVPKYAEYTKSTSKLKEYSGYYNLYSTYYNNGLGNLDLQIDFRQWIMITFAESVVFLLPFIVLYKIKYKK
jgi:glycopeptide antibiotics resistance protein